MSSQKQLLQSDRERLVLWRRREIALRLHDQAWPACAPEPKSAELPKPFAQFCNVHEYNDNAMKTLQAQYERIRYLREICGWRLARPVRWFAHKLLQFWNERERKRGFLRAGARELADFLTSEQRIVFRDAVSPHITVILVLYNRAELTFAALRSLIDALSVPAEVMIVDTGCRDLTSVLCSRIDGARFFVKKIWIS